MFVKPNILLPYGVVSVVTTHPGLVGAVVKRLLDGRAEVIVGDNSGIRGFGMNENSAMVSGIFDASLGCYQNIATPRLKHKLASRFAQEVLVSKIALDADLLISLPKLKTHSLTTITGAASKSSFAEMLIDIFSIRRPNWMLWHLR